MRWVKAGKLCSLLSVALLVAGPIGTRVGLWTFIVGFLCLAGSALTGLVGAVLSMVGGVRTRQWRRAAFGMAVGLAVVAVPATQLASAAGAPPIHDITTDTSDPPTFVAALPLRVGAANPPEYGGAAIADQQRAAFPDIETVALTASPEQAFTRVQTAVQAMGWAVTAEVPAEGRLEATDTTFWFGFTDDIVIRIRASDGGSRVDVRSKSRVGLGDAGTNARRVRAFLGALRTTP